MHALEIGSRDLQAIVIGASAGGAQALTALLPRIPRKANVAILIVLHLPRKPCSLLTDIFRNRCAVAVCEAQDKQRIEPNTVYFAPPDYHMLVDAGPQLALSIDDLVNYSRPSIDVLFESAADVYRERLLGIVLTGANDDGAKGLKKIHTNGGRTIVQDPLTAQFSHMPLAAQEMVAETCVMTLETIGALLETLNSACP